MQDLANWLEELYVERFAENGIDAQSSAILTGEDLEKIGVLLGHRQRCWRRSRRLKTAQLPQPNHRFGIAVANRQT